LSYRGLTRSRDDSSLLPYVYPTGRTGDCQWPPMASTAWTLPTAGALERQTRAHKYVLGPILHVYRMDVPDRIDIGTQGSARFWLFGILPGWTHHIAVKRQDRDRNRRWMARRPAPPLRPTHVPSPPPPLAQTLPKGPTRRRAPAADGEAGWSHRSSGGTL